MYTQYTQIHRRPLDFGDRFVDGNKRCFKVDYVLPFGSGAQNEWLIFSEIGNPNNVDVWVQYDKMVSLLEGKFIKKL